jgi:UDPglucose 6-dehydrogenase
MAVSDTIMPDRVVIGINHNEWARDLMEDLYRPITRVGKPLVFMNRESSEIVKYAANSLLATKISFINMLTELTEKTGANIRDVARGVGLDTRIGPRFLHAGIGYGGSCFPKDVKALLATASELGIPMDIVEATDKINARQRKRFFKQITDLLPANANVGILGLSFKPKTDDMRAAPSLDLIPELIEKGHNVKVFDPAAMEVAKPLLPAQVTFCKDALEAVKDADSVVVLTEWDEFRGIDLVQLKQCMRGNDLFDGRNIYEPDEVREVGLEYHGIGIG